MRTLIVLAIIFSIQMLSVCLADNIDLSQTKFIKKWIQAINTDDKKLLQEVIHPVSLNQINQSNYEYYNIKFVNDLRRTIPDNYQTDIEPIDSTEADTLVDQENYTLPVQPTHLFELSYKSNKYSGESVIHYLVHENDQWYFVLPDPTDQALNQFQKNKLPKTDLKQEAQLLVQDLEPEFANELRTLIQNGSQLKAYNLLRQTKDISMGVAKSIVEQLKMVH